MFFQLEVRSKDLRVRFAVIDEREGAKGTISYVVSSKLKSEGPARPKSPYDLMRGRWSKVILQVLKSRSVSHQCS